ncbi:MAG: hypothetical protein R3D85_11945 [Paracoccaceae bacterium]
MMPKLRPSRRAGRKEATDPLRRAVERLASDEVSDETVEEGGFGALIDRIAQEVDETILPRNFALIGASGEVAVLTVSNRRLLGVEASGSPLIPGVATGGRAAEEFSDILRAVWEVSAPLRLVLKGRADGFSIEDASCSALDLRQAAAEPAAEQGMEGFLSAVQAQAQAWFCRAGIAVQPIQDGAPEASETLTALARDVAAQRAKSKAGAVRAPSSQRPTCAILPYDGDRRVLVAEEADALILALADAAATEALVAAWKLAFRP